MDFMQAVYAMTGDIVKYPIAVSSNVAARINVSIIVLVCFTVSLDTFISIVFCSKNSFLAGLGLVLCLIVMLLSFKNDSKSSC